MFRKVILKKRLKKLAELLIERYGVQKNYTIGQIDTTMKMYNINKIEYYYYKLLFLNKNDYRKSTGGTDYVEKRKLLFLYLKKDIKKYNIQINSFARLLNIELNKFDNCHTPIKPNSNIRGYHGR